MDSSLGGLSRSSTVASLDTDSTKSSGQSPFSLCPPFLPTLLSNRFIWCVLSLGNSASETCAEFRVKYVGAIEKLQFNMSKTLQEPLDLIGYIDAAQVKSWRMKLLMQTKKRCCKNCFVSQQDGKLPFVPGDKEMILGVSKYGVKVASLDQCVSTTVIRRKVTDLVIDVQ